MKTQSVDVHSSSPIAVGLIDPESIINRVLEVHESLARRAYELFDGRGREDGHDLEDWLFAESELLRKVPAEITESGEELLVRAEVPGVSVKDLRVSVEPWAVIVTARSEESGEHCHGQTVCTERHTLDLFRRLSLPVEVNPELAVGTLTEGVLDLALPKAKAAALRVEAKKA